MNGVGRLFLLSGFMNVVALCVFNKGFAGAPAIAAAVPTVFSVESQYLIMLWGLAYASVASKWRSVPYLSLVFFLEKMLYVYFWVRFVSVESNLAKATNMVVSSSDILTGSFLLLAGPNDFLFGMVFAYAAYVGFQDTSKPKSG